MNIPADYVTELSAVRNCGARCTEDVTVTVRDLRNWYCDTYLSYKIRDKFIPVHIVDAFAETFDKKVTACFIGRTPDRSQISINIHDPDLNYTVPDLGYIEHGGVVSYRERLAQRQWRRGHRESLVHTARSSGLDTYDSLYLYLNGLLSFSEPIYVINRKLCIYSDNSIEYMGRTVGMALKEDDDKYVITCTSTVLTKLLADVFKEKYDATVEFI